MTSMTRQRTLAALGTVAVALGIVLGAAAPAAAHNYVVSSTPAEGETLTEVPAAFVITTNDILLDLSGEASGFGMLISDTNGFFYGDGCVTVDGRSMSTPAALGAAGDYTLTFQLISADGHTLSDTIAFHYEPIDSVTVQGGLQSPPVCPGREGTVTAPPATGDGDTGGIEIVDESATVLTIVGAAIGALAVLGVTIATLVVSRGRRAARRGSDTDGPSTIAPSNITPTND